MENKGNVSRRYVIIAGAVLIVALVVLIVGIVLIVKSSNANNCTEKGKVIESPFCELSEEGKRIGLEEFIKRVQKTYYNLHPFNVIFDPDVNLNRLRVEYSAFDITPRLIKQRTDASWELLDELNNKSIRSEELKPRERKAIQQLKHYLKHVFGTVYDSNFYSGEWMLGPDLFCYRHICYLGYSLYGVLMNLKPKSLEDMEIILQKLKTHEAAVEHYIENMKMGVRKGMVRSVGQCEAGINSIKRRYLKISKYNESGNETTASYLGLEIECSHRYHMEKEMFRIDRYFGG
ncbi:uncharacterized protein LOC125563171 [Nematostella vectensis]|uniref:uncharacterized protein LOC125563171 n=1 Tax=Nematostella vectensis TaxID=45351 RepID=UPI002076F548|nr:uncharacterized protein LOC125563171 [Nematostella vectensis]